MLSLPFASIGDVPNASALGLYVGAAAVALVYLMVWKKRKSGSAAGRLPPGPPGVPLLGNLPFMSLDLHAYFAKLAEIYGPVFSLRLGSKTCVVLSSPSAAREALKDHDAIFASHEPSAAALIITYGCSDLAFAPYGPLWRVLRKLCVRELLSNSSLEAVAEFRRSGVRRAAAALRLRAGGAVEVRELAFGISLGVMRGMLWGVEEDGEDTICGAAEFREVADGIMDLLEAPNVSDFFPSIARWDIQGVGRRMKHFSKRFDRIFETILEGRMKDGSRSNSRKDFLQVMLDLLKRNDPEAKLTIVHVKALLLDLIIGGTDTTSTTIEWAMAELLQNPEKLKKAQEELDVVVGNDRVVEESDIPHLPFLRVVLKEVFRLHPPVPLLVPRHPSESCHIHGYTIPEGAKVFVNAWAIQRDPVYWDDPLSFKPERFMDTTDKYDSSIGSNFNYLPFGAGRRVCVGYNLAERIVMYALATFLHSFDWKLPEGTCLYLNEKFGIALKKKEPLVAVPIARFENPKLYA